MDEFTQEMNQGNVDFLVSTYKKQGKQIPNGKFSIEPIIVDDDPIIEDNYISQYIDGKYGFKLLFKQEDENAYWIASTSFLAGTQLEGIYDYEKLSRYKNLPNPIIIQLQAISRNKYLYVPERAERAKEIIDTFKFEYVLTQIDTMFCKKINIPQVFLLPGELNYYYKKVDMTDTADQQSKKSEEEQQEKNERLILRYNGAASHCGFKKHQNGLYAYSIR